MAILFRRQLNSATLDHLKQPIVKNAGNNGANNQHVREAHPEAVEKILLKN